MSRDIDPITFEVLRNAMDSIADQMAIILMRSAYSGLVRESLDYSTGFCDAAGRLIAQGLTTPLHLGSFPAAMQHLIQTHGGQMHAGDVFALNDPYLSGGTHLPDLYVIKPVFHAETVEGFAATLAHHTDMGGITPGSNPVHSTEIYQEGLRIPLLKLYDRGRPNQALFGLIELNVRVPTKVLGDIRAQVAACHAGETAFAELLARYGAPTLTRYFDAMIDQSERLMRAAIAAVPDGTYAFTDHIDGLGHDPKPIVFRVAVTVQSDEIAVDWTGTSPQVKAGINSPAPFSRSACYLAIRSVIAGELPNNEGYMRPISILLPPDSIVNAAAPAACATRGITAFRMIDALLGALAQAVPDRVPAAGEGGVSWPSIGGYHEGRPFVYVESILGSWGGRPHADGTEGISHPGANQSNQPVEMIEADLPLEISHYGLVADSGGAGTYRGGLALVREYRVLAEDATLTIRTDRRTHRPYGLDGGRAGTPSSNILNPGPAQRILPALPMEGVHLRKGDVFRHITPGGGGYGNPLGREPAKVLDDVLDEKLTPDYAAREYGVIIDPRGVVDEEATRRLRRIREEARADDATRE